MIRRKKTRQTDTKLVLYAFCCLSGQQDNDTHTNNVPVCQTIMYRKARTREKNVNRSQSTSTHQHQSNDVSMSVRSTKLAWYNICSHSAGFLNLYNCTSPIPELTTTSHTPTGTERVNELFCAEPITHRERKCAERWFPGLAISNAKI